MKKYFYLFSLLFSSFYFSQTYHFDYLIKYLSVNKTTGFQDSGIILVNSSDPTYVGDLFEINAGENITFIIRDKKNELMHFFDIPRKTSPNLASNYKYRSSAYSSRNKKDYKIQKDAYFEETVLAKEEGGKKINLKKFRNSQSKKPEISVTAEYVNFEADLRAFNFRHLFRVDEDNITLPQNDKSFIKHAEWNVNKISGEYNAEVFKFNLNLVLKTGEVRLPKEKPTQKPFNLEEMKNTILEQRARN